MGYRKSLQFFHQPLLKFFLPYLPLSFLPSEPLNLDIGHRHVEAAGHVRRHQWHATRVDEGELEHHSFSSVV